VKFMQAKKFNIRVHTSRIDFMNQFCPKFKKNSVSIGSINILFKKAKNCVNCCEIIFYP
jgi:hypothetical protein